MNEGFAEGTGFAAGAAAKGVGAGDTEAEAVTTEGHTSEAAAEHRR